MNNWVILEDYKIVDFYFLLLNNSLLGLSICVKHQRKKNTRRFQINFYFLGFFFFGDSVCFEAHNVRFLWRRNEKILHKRYAFSIVYIHFVLPFFDFDQNLVYWHDQVWICELRWAYIFYLYSIIRWENIKCVWNAISFIG